MAQVQPAEHNRLKIGPTPLYTLLKFWRYNKVSLRKLVLLEILGKHQLVCAL